MDDLDVRIIKQHIDTTLNLEGVTNPGIFRYKSHCLWAAYEILDRVIKETEKLPEHISGLQRIPTIEIIEEFINDMDYFYKESNSAEGYLIFAAAKDEAEDIARLFI